MRYFLFQYRYFAGWATAGTTAYDEKQARKKLVKAFRKLEHHKNTKITKLLKITKW